jgi:5-formyltetrahydrofolate cyclo-ligase
MALATKDTWRKELLARRNALEAEKRTTYTHAAISHLVEFLPHDANAIVGLYHPIRSELSPLALPSALPQIRWAIPFLSGDSMQFTSWTPETPMQQGQYGIPEPMHPAPIIPDIILTPLVGMDTHGTRLGYGKGYYDRYFASETGKHALRIGLGFSCQQVEELPRTPHDMPLHYMVTEQGITCR